jgi:hypothetical protein
METKPAIKNDAQDKNVLVNWEHALWVDGLITDSQREQLVKIEDFKRADVRDNWCVVYFSGRVRWDLLISIFHPAPMVLQKNRECTILNLNFNPSEAQMEKLRAFLTELRLCITNCK